MRLTEILRLTLVNLRQDKFKVLLTSLGVIIGTLTIILVIAIGQGGEKQITDQFKNMSADTIYVNLDYTKGMSADMAQIPKLTPEAMAQIKEENPWLKDISLRVSFYAELRVGDGKENVTMAGVTGGWAEISGLSFRAGGDFTAEELEQGSRVVILGHGLAAGYYGAVDNAIGQNIRIGGKHFTVIGVLDKKSEGMQGLNPDDTVFLPYETAMEGKLPDGSAMPQLAARAKSIDTVDKAIRRIYSTLEYILDNPSYYIVEDAGSRMEAATQSARTMKMLLISIAAIVFAVGGIGIMNVMFVSVKERTREIGILKAIGTGRRGILLLFMTEALFIGVIGGLTGCVIGLGLIPLMSRTAIPVVLEPTGPLLALGFALGTAGSFGFYPAYMASRLKPIEALNQE